MKLKHLKFISTDASTKDFLNDLRDRVDQYFKENYLSKKYNVTMLIKSIVMIGLYIIPYILYLIWTPSLSISIVLWSLMAIGVSGIGMCIMHDANHGAYTQSHLWNAWIGKIINIIGGAAFNWKIQHNILHHTYTNIPQYDDDIDDKAILKLSPMNTSKWYHRYQHYYAFLFYAIATLYWCTVKDFIQLIRYTKEGLNTNTKSENIILWINLIISKFLYFFIFLIVPSLFFQIPFSTTIICFIWMHLIGGLLLTTVFQLAHTVEGTTHPYPNENLLIENHWAIHQLNTTYNFATKNPCITWFVGGLNFQVEHHLFPNICHIHYPAISQIVRKTANEYQLTYNEFPTLSAAFKAHITALKNFSKS